MSGSRPPGLAFLGAAAVAIVACSLWDHPAAEIAFAVLAVAFPVVLMAVGAARRGRLGSIALPIGALLVLLELCLVGMLLLRGRGAEAGWFLGLPAAAAIQIYGIFVAPLALVALGYALTFDRFGVAAEDLERLRAVARRRRGE